MFYFPLSLMNNIYLVMVKTNFALTTIKNKTLLENDPAVLPHRILNKALLALFLFTS